MTPRDPHDGGGDARRRFRTQAWVLAGISVGIYVAYLAFMIVKGSGGL